MFCYTILLIIQQTCLFYSIHSSQFRIRLPLHNLLALTSYSLCTLPSEDGASSLRHNVSLVHVYSNDNARVWAACSKILYAKIIGFILYPVLVFSPLYQAQFRIVLSILYVILWAIIFWRKTSQNNPPFLIIQGCSLPRYHPCSHLLGVILLLSAQKPRVHETLQHGISQVCRAKP